MCGIAGYSGTRPGLDLSAAMRAMAHRGPDGFGLAIYEAIEAGLAHVRLAIIDPTDAGSQPMANDDGTLVLSFNGEIYDYATHRQRLESRGVNFNGNSDTEVLLRLIEAEGVEAIRHVNGIFAFAILNTTTGELTVARDALGVKPLYYSLEGGTFCFASEVKALLALGANPGAIDEPAVARYLTYLWCPGEGLPVKNLRKLGPGEVLSVRRGVLQSHRRWYELPSIVSQSDTADFESDVRDTAEFLRRAVHRQLVSDVPVGAFLSGGLDSSAVVAFARQLNPDIKCFTISSAGSHDDGDIDDLPYAVSVANHLGVNLDVVEIDPGTIANDFEFMVRQLDEPLADPAPLNVFYISKLARERGIKVLLSGAGGDDLFTGYRRHRAATFEHALSRVHPKILSFAEVALLSLDQRNALFRRAAKLFSGSSLGGDARIVNYFAWSRRDDLHRIFSPDFRDAVSEVDIERPMMEFLASRSGAEGPLETMLALDQRFFLADHNLMYTDKMAMACGVEVRVPFLDTELVERVSRIPSTFKQRGRNGKWVLKKAMEPYLPRSVIYRPKAGFGAPLRRWIREDLRELMLELLSKESLRKRGMFSHGAVSELISLNDSGRRDVSHTILSLMCIEVWFRSFVDNPEIDRPVDL